MKRILIFLLALCTLGMGVGVAAVTHRTRSAHHADLSRSKIDLAIGQMLMSHVSGAKASPQFLARVRRGEIGGVILFGENVKSDAQVRALAESIQGAAKDGGMPPVFISTDQEGGAVKRIKHAPPTMSARAMGERPDPFATARAQGRATGRYLRRVGINVDLAPVADVPTGRLNFLGSRACGNTVGKVAAGATGFAVGLAESKVGASAKHFPGLGAAGERTTDLQPVRIAASRTALRARYVPYSKMAKRGPDIAPLVMISNASYPSLDRRSVPAVFSEKIVRGELARARMSDRVTISDDLEAGAIRGHRAVAVRAVLAGMHILLYASTEAASARAFIELKAAEANGVLPRELVLRAAKKITELKQRLALR